MIYVATDTGSYTVAVSRPICQMSTTLPLRVTQEDIRLRVTSATLCGGTGSAHLFAQTNEGTLFWYNAPTEGNLLATDSHFVTPALNSDQRFFVSVNEFSGTVPFTSLPERRQFFFNDQPEGLLSRPRAICARKGDPKRRKCGNRSANRPGGHHGSELQQPGDRFYYNPGEPGRRRIPAESIRAGCR